MAGGVITTGNHPKAQLPGVKAWFGRTYNEVAPEYPDMYDMETSDQSYEEYVELTGFDLAQVKDQGAATAYSSETQGYVARLTNVAYGLGYIVTREELDDNRYEIVSKRRAKALAFSFRQTKEINAANVYNRCTSGSYLGGDGVCLLSVSHVTMSGVQANTLSTAADLSEAALEDLINVIMQAKNSKGHTINLMPNGLIIPPQLWFEANRILKSTLQNDSAQNAVNVLKMTNALPGGIKMSHYLTDADAWFVRTNVQQGMVFQQRIPIEFKEDNDFDTDNAKMKGYERYTAGWGDWRGLYGSVGA